MQLLLLLIALTDQELLYLYGCLSPAGQLHIHRVHHLEHELHGVQPIEFAGALQTLEHVVMRDLQLAATGLLEGGVGGHRDEGGA